MVAGLPARAAYRRAVALVVPSVICAITVAWLRFMGIGGESAPPFIGVLTWRVAAGRRRPAALSALLSGMLLNYFLTEPRYSDHRRTGRRSNRIRVVGDGRCGGGAGGRRGYSCARRAT